MFFILEPADAMSRFPRVDQYPGVLCFITNRASQPTVVLVCMREYDATNIGNANPSLSQAFMERVIGGFGFGAGIDKRDRIFRDQIDIDRANIEWRGKRDGNDAHETKA